MPLTAVTSVIDGLKRLYVEKLKPLEVAYRYNDFASPLLVNNSIHSFVLFEVSVLLFQSTLMLIVLFRHYLHVTSLLLSFSRQTVILMQSQWLCSWVSIQQGKQRSLSIC